MLDDDNDGGSGKKYGLRDLPNTKLGR